MISFVLSLALLSVMFTLISGAAFLYRKLFMKGREGMMYPVWIIVLAVSVIPLRFDLPAINNITADETIPLSEMETEYQGDYDEFEHSERQYPKKTGQTGEKTTVEYDSRIILEARKILVIIAARFDTISSVIFTFWLFGALISFARSMSGYLEAKKLLLLGSSVCTDERLISMLLECKQKIGLLRKVRLRVFDGEALCSPCVCGCIFPVLYLEPGCAKLPEKELRCVLTHELNHIRRRDMIVKLFSLFVSSVHWMNPTSRKVLKIMFEDCELACDYNVLKVFGRDISSVYMTTILNFAERFSENNRLIGAQGINEGLFISHPSGAVFLKRRYANMKNFKKNYIASLITVLFAAVCVSVNIFALSSCSAFVPENFGSMIKLSKPVEQMLRTYYGLGQEDKITAEMVDGITSLTVSINTIYEDHILADFIVNGDEGYAKALPLFAISEYWNNNIQPAIDEANNKANETAAIAPDGKAVKPTFKQKIEAFYCLKDPDMPDLTERARQEMLIMHPYVKEKGGLYVFDPYASEREIKAIYKCFDEAGLIDMWEVDSAEFDASQFAYFNKLTEIKFVGFTPVNYTFPSDVKVTVVELDLIEESGMMIIDGFVEVQ